MSGDSEIIDSIRSTIDQAVQSLQSSRARDEALAIFVAPRRVLLITKAARFIPIGRVWRLGAFLLDGDGTLYETGSTTRAVAPGYPGFQSNSAEERRGYRAAAFAGPFHPGETVNFGAKIVALDADDLRSSTGALFLNDDTPLVRWNPTATADTAIEFDSYLAERVDLLVHPPEGA